MMCNDVISCYATHSPKIFLFFEGKTSTAKSKNYSEEEANNHHEQNLSRGSQHHKQPQVTSEIDNFHSGIQLYSLYSTDLI
jgi:hypothetical protein